MANAEFGTVFFSEMTLASFDGEKWSDASFVPSDRLPMHPAAHVLHYASTCFEGMKAFRANDGAINVFRIDDHIRRMQNSARSLYLPVPDAAQLKSMIIDVLKKFQDQVPVFPGSAYIRPTLIGTDPAIGRAAAPTRTALLYILVSPVGDYFAADAKMRVLLDTDNQRCAPHFGNVKSGGNYASALGLIQKAKEKYNTAQVIFAPNGDVQETGAANCLLINDTEILTKPLNSEFLPGVTRDSLLKAGAKLGYKVTERNISADELMEWIKTGEVALSGTAAVLAPVGEIVYKDETYAVNGGKEPVNAKRLRKYLNDVQQGLETDSFNWVTKI
ncbi:branched-chain-amino-acid transaminase [Undibacterium sp. TS12]|uniref:branched-chain-amino-acid transaminase n=1 Tax=Undibacterium sp. TS12 TaxID=2908202 RepID=UPI001F4C5DB0|nr:branched-chain-amino-acid transaminase [Undibacterium sp. TS12]MCH8619280.1 branched-chain-amino-acid transaminase [Undibacterium sp. TS12]